jgi:hypothetical protein
MKENLRFTDALAEARQLVKTEGPGLIWDVEFAQSAGVKALGVPHGFLKAVSMEVAGDMVDDPRWPTHSLHAGWEWQGTPLALVLKKEEPAIRILFKTAAEIKED